MGLYTNTDVEEVSTVDDGDPNDVDYPTNLKEQKAIRDAVGSRDTLSGFVYTTDGTDPEALDSYAVPEGVTVLVHALGTNAGVVRVGPQGAVTYPLSSADAAYTTQVADTSEIYIETPNAGDEVAVHFEEDS